MIKNEVSSRAADNVKSLTLNQSITVWEDYLKKSKIDFNDKLSRNEPKNPNVGLHEFTFHKTLGQGAYGRVMLIERTGTGKQYAAKLQEKKAIIKSKLVNQIYMEKKFLEAFQFPFLVNLEFFFQDNVYLYFVMNLLEGGDMFTFLRKKGKFDEHLSRFYGAQVLLALEYMHYLDLLYRDLKPENILLDREGYIKVADLGFCKNVKHHTYTLCGTPEYIAPEILQSKGYGKSADYWSFGVLLFEFNSGSTPFYSEDQMRIYEKIVEGKFVLKSYFSNDLKDIIKNLIQNDISRRYGILRRGIEDIKDHKWFRKIVWLALVNKGIKPPCVPRAGGHFERIDDEPLEKRSHDPYKNEFAHF